MNLHKPFSIQSIFLPTLLLVIAWLVSGCSGSSDTVALDGQPSINSAASEANNSNGNSDETIDAIETESDTEVTSADMMLEDEVNEAESDTEITSADMTPGGEVDEAVNNSPVVADPLIQNTVPVTFDINVPFYLSNELQVKLVWGDINITAIWVVGQLWSATGEFPTETEHPLTITFYDNNGAVELARYNQPYRVSPNSTVSEHVYISAEQFDANQFDSDGDGVNNLAELNVGTDPFDQDSLLILSDALALSISRSQYSRISASQTFESHIQQDRPYVDMYEIKRREELPTGEYKYNNLYGNFRINIDSDGNGSLDVDSDEAVTYYGPRLSATRINSGSSITWTAEHSQYDGDYAHRENITNTVSVVDENLRSFVQEATGHNNGTFRFSWMSSANLTGRLIEGTSLCKPVAGTFTETRQTNYIDLSDKTIVTTASKKIDDPYWKVVTTDTNSGTIEYFARDLEILHDTDDEDSAFFTCDFVDF